ncbi:MAG TPA: hypothetical protein PLF22_09220 [Pseudomonadales bacterium]|nr:hypothetical protein [Pseudomonadales bacterium]
MRTVKAPIGYMSADGVAIDTLRPGGVLRAPTRPNDDEVYKALAMHECTVHDLAAADALLPSLGTTGFDTIDLSSLADLQSLLQGIGKANTITHEQIKRIHRLLLGKSFRLSNGKKLRILFVAGEGTILRKAGPNALKINVDEPITDINGHDGAQAVHGDQDVRGTPVRQMLKGAAPWIFRHEAPDGFNRRSPLFLLNLWIPLQQITRPLVLMDERTLDRQKHQLRYALPTAWFLDRPEDRQLNDIWTYLHDPAQQWYFTSELDSRRAYVFNTLGNPHGSFILPGEDIAEQLYKALQAACRASQQHDSSALQAIATPDLARLPADCPAPLRKAIDAMVALLQEVKQQPAADWEQRALAAMDRVVRKSIEMRTVCWVS